MKPPGVRAFLERHGLAAHRTLGQNFLVDEGLARRLAELAGVGPADAVIEIGTGLGILTRALAARARRVVTVEVDAGLVRGLRADDLLPEGTELRHADALELDLAALARELGSPVRLVANLPYSVASPLLRRLLDLRALLVDWSVMVQREVAARLLAPAGSRDFGSLAVLHALTVRGERLLDLHPGCFHPAPRVVSSFVRFVPRADAVLAPGELEAVERVARAAFTHRRKTLANALRGVVPAEHLERVLAGHGLHSRLRPEQVPPEVWRDLARTGAAEGQVAHGA